MQRPGADETKTDKTDGHLTRRPTETGIARPLDVSRLSTPELVARIAQDAQDLVRAEVTLAKTEVRTTYHAIVATIKRVAFGVVLLTGAFFTLIAAAVLGLAQVVPGWAAALIVGGGLSLVGGGLVAAGVRARPDGAGFDRTVQSLKEDLRVAKDAT